MPEQAHTPGRFFAVAFIVILAVIACDQYTKWMALEALQQVKTGAPGFADWFTTRNVLDFLADNQPKYDTVTINPWLDFTMVWNRGISFGLFDQGSTLLPVVFMAFSMLVSMALFIWMAVAHRKLLFVALPLVIGGALGNVCDRIRFGAVVDFIDVHLGDKHWPAFNVADSCVCIGFTLLLLDTFLNRDKDAAKLKAA